MKEGGLRTVIRHKRPPLLPFLLNYFKVLIFEVSTESPVIPVSSQSLDQNLCSSILLATDNISLPENRKYECGMGMLIFHADDD